MTDYRILYGNIQLNGFDKIKDILSNEATIQIQQTDSSEIAQNEQP